MLLLLFWPLPVHSTYITTSEFNKVTAESVAARLAHANLGRKRDVVNFDDKLKKFNKNVTSNKTKYVLVETELNELSKKVEVISTKRLSKGLIKGPKIQNSTKYFSSGILQDYLVFIPAQKHIEYFSGTTRMY